MASASLNGRREMVKDLLKKGMDPNSLFFYPYSVFTHYIQGGDKEMVELFIEHGANINKSGYGVFLFSLIILLYTLQYLWDM